jgi:glycosyltransferase A (GT-A) superfamily protein (DUF2064 family)
MSLDNKHSSSVAILVFAQSDKVESAFKPIAYRKRQNDLLWHKMNQKIVQTVHKTRLPYFISDENTQEGDSFGSKLGHAIQTVLNKGYDKVIVLGNDSPGLRLAHLQEAFIELQDKNVVLGSDFRGGTYLIGISRVSFNKEAFAKIDWQTPKVFGQLQALYSAQTLGFISPLADCNTRSDFEKLLHELPFYSSFKSVLASLLLYAFAIYSFVKHFHVNAIIGLNFNKGSPVLE